MSEKCSNCKRVTTETQRKPLPPTTDLLWVVGLYEGEGSVVPIRGQQGWQVSLQMVDLDVIERLQVCVGAGNISVVPRKNKQTQYSWRLSNKYQTLCLLQRMLPLLGIRRAARAREAIMALEGAMTHCSKHGGKINGSQESEAGFSTIHPDGRGDSGESPPVHSVDQETEGAQ